MISIYSGFYWLEGRTNTFFKFVEENSLKRLPQEGIVKIFHLTEDTVIREAAFGDQAVDMRIPFEWPSEGMKDADEARDKVSGLIKVKEHAGNYTVNGIEEAIEERAVFEEKVAKLLINGKNTMTVMTLDKLQSHGSGSFLSVFDAAGRAKTAFAAERNEFPFTAFGAAIHSATKRGVSAIDHFFNVFHDDRSWMESIFNYFIIVRKDLLQDIHMTIMQ